MTSLSTRLTALYAASLVVVSAGMLAIGYRELQDEQVRSLDMLLHVERERVFTHLAREVPPFTPAKLAMNLRKTTDNSARLFRVEIRDARGASLFRSSNLPDPFAVALDGWTIDERTLGDGAHVRVHRFPYGALTVLIATPMAAVDAATHDYLLQSGALLAVTVLVSIAIGYVLSQIALRPLRSIASTAARVGSDNLSERIALRHMDREVGDLARLLNAMLDRIEASFRQIRQFTIDASHELKTPLTLVRLHAEAQLDERNADERENGIVAQLELIDRLSSMVEDLLLLARADSNSMPLDLRPHDPAAFFEGLRGDGEVLAEAAGCRLSIDHAGAGRVAFDSRWIRQTLLNLLTNAFRASGEGTNVVIRSRLTDDGWTVGVIDQGPGVADDRRIFDRFFTTSEGGTGLGLAICKSIVELHGGWIRADSRRPERGMVMEFHLPARRGSDERRRQQYQSVRELA